jgi:hypothetical protein
VPAIFLKLRKICSALIKDKWGSSICLKISKGLNFCRLKNFHHLTSKNNKNLIVFENFGGNEEIKKGKVCREFIDLN